jgi:thiol-disulfide isomerase/thioredoxin
LIVPPSKKYFELLIDKEQTFSFETDTTSKMVEHMKIKGSDDNAMFYKYLDYISVKGNEAEPLRKRMAKIKEDSLMQIKKKDSLKILQDKISAIDKDVQNYQEKVIKDHPESFLSVIFKAQKDITVPETPILPNGRKDSTFPYSYYKNHYWDNIPLSDDRILRTPLFHNKLKYYLDKVVIQHPDSIIKETEWLIQQTKGNKEMFKYIVWYTTTTYETSNIMGMDAVFVHLVENYYATWKAYWVDSTTNKKIIHRGFLLKPLLLEKPAPGLVLQDSLDKNVSLYEVKSKYTVVIFWDPDCGHCQKIVPKLKEIYDSKLKAKGVTVYAVQIEDKDDKWKQFVKEKKLDWINVRDKYKNYYLHDLYDIYSTPVIYILDENKRIKAKRIDVEQLDGFIDHLNKVAEIEKKKGK